MTTTPTERRKAFFAYGPLFWAGFATLATFDRTLDAIGAAFDHKPLAAVRVVMSIAFAVVSGVLARWFLRRAAPLERGRDLVIRYAFGLLTSDVENEVAAGIEEVKAECVHDSVLMGRGD